MRTACLRCCSLLLILGLLFGILPAAVVSAEEPYTYEILEGEAVITLYNGTEETVTVPETLGGAPVTAIGAFAFEGASLKALVLPDSLKRLEDGAFFGCEALEKVTFGKGLTHLGEAAFADCVSLSELLLPASLASLGSQAFSGCNGLTVLAVEAGCETFRSSGNCIVEIAAGALVAGCGSSVIPDDGSVASIAPYAFSCIKSLTSLEIPESVTAIGDGAFESTGLTRIFLPSAVAAVGKYILHGTPLTALYCGGEAKPEEWHQKWNGGVGVPPLWSYDNTCAHTETRWESLEPVCTADGYRKEVCCLCESALSLEILAAFGHTEHTQTIPSTCAKEGYTRVFCTVCGEEFSRKELPLSTVHGTLRTETAASSCEGDGYLKKICTVCGKTMSAVVYPAEGHTVKTETVQPTCAQAGYTREVCTVCGEVLSYEEQPKTEDHPALETRREDPSCTADGYLREVCTLCGTAVANTVLPAAGHSHEEKTVSPTCRKDGYTAVACRVCGEEKEYTLLPALGHTYGENGLCAYCGIPEPAPASEFTVTVCSGGLEILSYTGNSTHVVIPAYINGEPVVRIADGAFEKTKIQSVTFPATLQEIGSFAFSECTLLEEIILPPGVRLVEEGAFAECVSAKRLYLGEGVESILHAAFAHCDALSSVELPASLSELSPGAFFGCKGLTRLTVREGNAVFASVGNCIVRRESGTLLLGCISSVIPADGSIKQIGAYAFDGVAGLTSLTLPEGLLSVGAYAFRGTGLTSLRLPSTVASVGRYILFDTPAQQVYVSPAEKPDAWHGNWIAGSEAEVFWGGASCTHGEQVLLKETVPGCLLAGSRVYGCSVCGDVTLEEAVPAKGHTYRGGVCDTCRSPEGLRTELQNGTYCIVGYDGTAEVLVLPGVVDGIPVTAVAAEAFAGNTVLKTVFLPASLTLLGEGIFRDCQALEEIRLERGCALVTWHESWAWGTRGAFVWNAEEPSSEPILYGDVNLDGRINVLDYGMLKRYAMKGMTFSPEQMVRGDVNLDGRINVLDYSIVKRQAMKAQ